MTDNVIGPSTPYWDTSCSFTSDPTFSSMNLCGKPSRYHIMTTYEENNDWVGVFACEEHYSSFNPFITKMIHESHHFCGMPDAQWNTELNMCTISLDKFEKDLLG